MTQRFVRVFTPRVVLTLIVLAALGTTVDTYRYLSHTWDEPAHIANGLLLLDFGKYIEYQHPPLARLATAIGPYLGGARSQGPAVLPAEFGDRIIDSFDEGRRILYQTGGSYDRVLTLSRLGILPFLILLLLATYLWTRRLLGEWTAVLAAFYLAATPIVLGNAGIATLDLPFTALAIASLVVYCRWLEQPTLRTGTALGAITGAAIMSKFSAIPFLGLCFVTLAVWYAWLGFPSGHHADAATSHQTSVTTFRRQARLFASRPHLKSAAVAFGALLVVFWLSYDGGLVSLADPANRPYRRVDDLFGPGTTASRIVSDALELKVFPYFVHGIREGIKDLSIHNQLGHPSYLLGERGKEGWWNYYIVGLGVRTPLTLLVIGLIGLTSLVRVSVRDRAWQLGAPSIAFATLLVFVSLYSRINLGVRHILVLYPLLAMGTAYVTMSLVTCRRVRPIAVGFAAVLVLSQVSSVVLTHPDHLTYFNVIVAGKPERFLIPADLDWGQDVKRLEAAVRERGINRISVAIYGSNDLSRHALPGYSPLKPNVAQAGWIAISLWRLYRDEDFSWLRAHEPVARVGTSVNLYYIDDPSLHGHGPRSGS